MLKKAMLGLFFLVLSTQIVYAIVPPEEKQSNEIYSVKSNLILRANSINLDKALELGLLHNPKLKVARAKLGISDAQILQAGLIPNPTIISDNGFAEDTFRVGVEQTIELGNKRSRRIKLARIQKEVVKEEIVSTILDVRSSIRSSYIDVYNAQQKLFVAEEIFDTTSKLTKIAEKREQSGDIAKLDVLQAEIMMVNAKNSMQSSKLELYRALNALSADIGVDLNRNIVLAPPNLVSEVVQRLQIQDDENEEIIDKLIDKAYDTRPEIKAIQRNIDAQNQRLKVARANIVPDITVSVGGDFVTGEEKRTNAFVMGSLDVPVFNRQQGVIKEIRAQKAVYEKELEAQKNIVEQEVRNAYSDIVASVQLVKIYENELLPKAKSVVNKSEVSFREGKCNILVPLNSQEAYINTKFGYIQVLNEYEKAVSDLERAIGIDREEQEKNL